MKDDADFQSTEKIIKVNKYVSMAGEKQLLNYFCKYVHSNVNIKRIPFKGVLIIISNSSDKGKKPINSSNEKKMNKDGRKGYSFLSFYSLYFIVIIIIVWSLNFRRF